MEFLTSFFWCSVYCLQGATGLTAHGSLVWKISPTFTGNLWLNLRRPEPALPHSLTNTVETSTPMMLRSVSLELSAGLRVSVSVIWAHSLAHFLAAVLPVTHLWSSVIHIISVFSHFVYLSHIFPLCQLLPGETAVRGQQEPLIGLLRLFGRAGILAAVVCSGAASSWD